MSSIGRVIHSYQSTCPDPIVMRAGDRLQIEDNPTDKANFNEKDIQWILSEFQTQREIYVNRLDALKPESFEKSILHPRLNKPMRLCDMLSFHAEHDQHHLTRIVELKALWKVG